jgi:periplasmic protein TonB
MRLIYKSLFMEPNQIKEAHILDILFEGRNKEYGAYELRKTYNRRIVKAIFAMVSVVGLLFLGGVVSGFGKGKRAALPFEASDVDLRKVDDVKPPVIPPPRVQPVVQVATIRLTTTRIVPDDQVKPDEKPPENAEADHVNIGTETRAGVETGDLVGPPSASGSGGAFVDAPKKSEPDGPWTTVEIEASYMGGSSAWARFLNKNLRYPEDAINIGVSGTVMVQFVVDLDGNVSDVKVVSGPEQGGLREEAVRVIMKSGKWVPAVQNGRHVKAYRRQPVTFVKSEDN